MTSPLIPPHQDSKDPKFHLKGDGGGYFPTAESALGYKDAVIHQASGYHKDRLRAIKHLLSMMADLRLNENSEQGVMPVA